jgi:PAS domain S-box-containing protein
MFRHREITEAELEDLASGQLEETVGRQVRVFEVLLNRSREGILLVTPEMNILRVVHTAIGYPAAELLGSSLLSFIHPDDMAMVSASFAQLLATQKDIGVCQCRALGLDRSWRWIEIQMTDLLDDPDVGAVLFNYQDITERKQLLETAQRLAAYLNCPGYAMFTQDPGGIVLDWNAGAELAFSYSAAEMVGQNMSRLIPADLRDREAGIRAQVLQGAQVGEYRTERVCRDGTRVPTLVSLSVTSTGPPAIVQISHADTAAAQVLL